MNSVFSEEILAEKFSKLNSTQQCIETLSHWCIFHRDKAELVVTTWAKQFHVAEMAQKVPLLYLANDILQNSKRKGNEFVMEFWKVLPAALKYLIEKGDDRAKNVVSRLVGIWEERRVFGGRAKNIKAVMLGEEQPQQLEFSKKRSRSVKIVKRDSKSIRTKLTIGGAAERIVSAFHLVLSEHHGEDEEMDKCKSAVHRVRKMDKSVDLALRSAKDPKRKTLAKELEEEESILKQCIDKLKVVEANRVALVSQLRDALNDQESELENVRTQMQVAQAQAEEARTMRKRLDDETYVPDSKPSTAPSPTVDANGKGGGGTKKTAAAIAAEVADKLTASTSSQYIMSSVLSTFAAQEAKSVGLTNTISTSKTEQPLAFISAPPLNNIQSNGPYQTVLMPQISNSQPQYHTLSISNPPAPQYLQQSGGIMTSYGYSNIPPLPPGPPPPPPPPQPPSFMMSPMVPLTQQQFQISQHHQPFQQQPLPPPSFRPLGPMQPSGMVFYTQPHNSQ